LCLAAVVGRRLSNLNRNKNIVVEFTVLPCTYSIRSFFEFRTFDPEGAIFYGDTKEGLDWFVLSLRDGIPEMQIGKADILVSIKGGHKLNDGAWHLVNIVFFFF